MQGIYEVAELAQLILKSKSVGRHVVPTLMLKSYLNPTLYQPRAPEDIKKAFVGPHAVVWW